MCNRRNRLQNHNLIDNQLSINILEIKILEFQHMFRLCRNFKKKLILPKNTNKQVKMKKCGRCEWQSVNHEPSAICIVPNRSSKKSHAKSGFKATKNINFLPYQIIIVYLLLFLLMQIRSQLWKFYLLSKLVNCSRD
jgi:hypothetical protein